MKTAFTEELRLWSIKFMCEPLSHGINDCEYVGELLQLAQHVIETTLDVSKPNCTECAKWAKEQADNREWIAGVKEGWKIVERMAQSVIGKAITEPPCKDYPDALHGFNRNASHSAGRYMCDCEGWEAAPAVKGAV